LETGTVRLEVCGSVGRIVLDRPRKRNALSTHLLAELGGRLDDVAASPDVRVVTLHGAGPVFCAGADTGEFADITAELIRGRWTRLGQQVFRALAELPQTTVAVLAGSAFGGGLELALHCDFRVAAADIRLGLPEATLGTTPGWSGLGRITEIAGLGAARRLALTGAPVTAAEALRLGIVDIVDADTHAATDQLVDNLLATAPGAQSILKRALITAAPAAALIDSLAGAYLAASGETLSRRKP
jgi:enoyl-CoA hydratase/carnithine racemase